MRLHRFFVGEEIGAKKELVLHSAELAHQIRRVLRMKPGDHVILFNGTGFDYECKIDSFTGRSTIVSDNSIIKLFVTETRRSRFVPERRIFLGASLVKKDNFEWITEKATELGATDIVPVAAERSEKKFLDEKRLRRIAVEASEQSGRGSIPMVHPIMGLLEAAELFQKSGAKILAFHTEGKPIKREDLEKLIGGKDNPVAIFTGPEGGWSDEEIAMFHAKGIEVLCLGGQILRAETAAMATLSLVTLG